MTTKLQKLFPTPGGNAYEKADTVNHAGAPAFTRSLEERTLQVLMVGNLESTYYCTAADLTAQAIDTLTQMATMDAEFLAKAIVYARNEGYLRIAPIVGLLVLSKARPDLFKQIFKSVILQPGDLQDFVTLVRSKSVRSTGKSVRSAVGAWMNAISEYHVVKYGAPQKKAGSGTPTNLRDILRLTHPKPADAARQALFSYIVKRIKGEDLSPELIAQLPEKIVAYERFKELTATPELTKANEEEAIALVMDNDLPYEVVTSRLPTPGAWAALAFKAPFMNMLRNLNNYEKYGVFKNAELKALVISRLKDEAQIRKSKLFPFRFLAAYNAFQGDPEVRDALTLAVEKSVLNIPDLGRTLVAPDESGSMASPVSEKSDITMKQIGNLFAGALWKKSEGGFMVPFESYAHPVGFSKTAPVVNKRDSLVTIAEKLGTLNGGTSLSAPLEWAMTQDFDTGVFITDSESWADLLNGGGYRYGNSGVLDKIRTYRKTHPKTHFFFIQLVPNDRLAAPKDEPGVHYIYGWSDNVLKYIATTVAGGQDQVQTVRATSIPEATVQACFPLMASVPSKVEVIPVKASKVVVKPVKASRAVSKTLKAKKKK